MSFVGRVNRAHSHFSKSENFLPRWNRVGALCILFICSDIVNCLPCVLNESSIGSSGESRPKDANSSKGDRTAVALVRVGYPATIPQPKLSTSKAMSQFEAENEFTQSTTMKSDSMAEPTNRESGVFAAAIQTERSAANTGDSPAGQWPLVMQKQYQNSEANPRNVPTTSAPIEPLSNYQISPAASGSTQTKTVPTSENVTTAATVLPTTVIERASSQRTTTEKSETLVTEAIVPTQSSKKDADPMANDESRSEQAANATIPQSPSPFDEKTASSSAIEQDLPKTTESNAVDLPDGPRVTLLQGELLGVSVTVDDKLLDAYFGVPYAETPETRFARAKEIKSWNGVRLARNEAEPCRRWRPQTTDGSCLHLNVLSPRASKGLPVLVWFVGDGINGEEASVQLNFSALSANENLLVITVSYRVGVFGFLNASLDDVEGDIGFYDQIVAMEFLADNVEAFGGDRDSVTIGAFGFSGAVAGLHLLDATTSTMFQRIMLLSGSPLMLNTRTFRNVYDEYLEATQCERETRAESLDCVKEQPVPEIASRLKFGPTSKAGTALPESFGKTDIRGKRILLGSYTYSGWKDDTDVSEFLASRDPDNGRLVMLKEAVELRFGLQMASVSNREIFRAYAPSAPANLQENIKPEILRLIGEMTQDFLHRCPDTLLARNIGLKNDVYMFELDYPDRPLNELKLLLDPESDSGQSRKSSDLSRNVRQQIATFIRGG